ncbi:oligosaccharide flippase family protein [Marinobacter sp. TBZ242]|uniref:Oligosaccharide flippase family protein n=1 Tax=Marinobacter azerbaijanicus TaxID=3050455 RepID=A0ABT7I9D0_9GAMM|nr:oligosaccharide flippase family protein [Marinobacter sp. TBZ242]MDL0429764.1 oligosaccharide flippase family protein [Marinobacter sp. TBZ242]
MSRVLFSVGVIQVFIILTGMIRAKILSMVLGPSGFGIIATIDQVVLTVVQVAGFGIPFFSLKFMSRAHSEGNSRLQTVYSSFLSGLLLLSLLTTGIVIGITYWNPAIFGVELAPYKLFIIIALLNVPAMMLGIFFVHTLAAAQMTSASATLNLVVTFCLAFAASSAAWLFGMNAIYVCVAITGVVTTVGSVWYIKRKLSLNISDPSAGILKELRRSPEIISFSLFGHAALSAYSIAMLIARYEVFSTMGEAQAGFLQAMFGIALALGAISGPLNILYLTPILNRNIPNQEKFDNAHEFQGLMILIIFILSLPFLLFPKLALTILYSSEFRPASGYLYLFIFWQSMYVIVNVYRQLLVGLDDVKFFSISTLLSYIVAIAATPFLVERFGLPGAALSLSLSVFLNGLAIPLRLSRRFKTNIPPGVWLRIVLCLVGIIFTGLLFPYLEEFSMIGFAARVVYVALLTPILWKLLPVEQKRMVLDGISRIRTRGTDGNG